MSFGLNWGMDENKEEKKESKDILYADSIKKRDEEKKRLNLLYELGDNLTNAQVLYSPVDELENLKKEMQQKQEKEKQEKRYFIDPETSKKLQNSLDEQDFQNMQDAKETYNLKDFEKPQEIEHQKDDKNLEELKNLDENENFKKEEENFEDGVQFEEIDEDEYYKNAVDYKSQNEGEENGQHEENKYAQDETQDSNGVLKGEISSNWRRTYTKPEPERESYFIDVSEHKKPQANIPAQTISKKNDNFITRRLKETGDFIGGKIGKVKNDVQNKIVKTAKDVAVKIFREHPSFKDFIIEKTPEPLIKNHIGKNYGKLEYGLAKDLYGPHTAGILDTQHEKMVNPEYIKDAILLDSVFDKRIEKYQTQVREKVAKQFNDYKKTVNMDKLKGYYFKRDSEVSKSIAQSENMKNFLIKNKKAILNKSKEKLSINLETEDLSTAIHLMDLVDIKFDKAGNGHSLWLDTGEYNKGKDKNENPKHGIFVKAAAKALDENQLQPRYYMYEVTIPRKQLQQLGY